MVRLVFPRFAAVALLMTLCADGATAREYLKSDWAQQRGFSDAVVTQGGRVVWLAGHVGLQDEDGKSLAGDFQGQARAIFRALARTLERAGGSLRNLTTITVYLTDPRHLEALQPVRREFFPDGRFPASTTIAVSNLPLPGMLIEIQGVAVIGDE